MLILAKEGAVEVTARIAHDLAESSQLETTSEGTIAISSYRGRRFTPAVSISLDGVSDYLESMAGDALDVFPSVDANEGAYRLLLVHLEEAMLAGGDTPLSIAVRDRGIFVSRSSPSGPDDKAEEVTGDDMSWTTERP
jgi:hypothetical protein